MPIAFLTAATEEEAVNPLIPEPYDIIWSLVVFAIVAFFFIRYVLPRVQKVLDDRTTQIQGGIEKAEKAQEAAADALDKYTQQLAEARIEAGRIREQAREDGKKILAELREQALAEAARITASAQATIEAERQAAVTSLRAEVGSLAIDLASGVVGESLSDDKKAAALVDRFLADLEASETSASTTSARKARG
ncbi:F0F1 ATP synthase subunit B [Naasia lichenicola]|uniref:ATP synthase subunit b n=1 Tax=Naasia lichenicola TaxID=2565933 RepID=A0A4S4FNN8_9MICO|nr:F0F1 ATP synthase subunit B [Naasia lichenicola]THG31492.1 F0F1 ATP synthase subunit B [Naasia lichenicola]